MDTIQLKSWAEFDTTIANIRQEWGLHSDALGTTKNNVLFRGQSDAKWGLQTSLERACKDRMSVQQYMQKIDFIVNRLESLTGRSWGIGSIRQIYEEINNTSDSFRVHIPSTCYPYMVYLRHHGFPSPLLDWTNSPYIAAYFAYEGCAPANTCAIYVYVDQHEGQSEGDVMISHFGPHVTTHARHVLQKASYTIATKYERDTNTHYFCSHDPAAHQEAEYPGEVSIKVELPGGDRIAALKQLDDYNINAYSLFGTEDSLVRSLAIDSFDFD